ncbi:MFS transporter [Amphritea balenae]|uniref:MFS transporter n=1 Tax=Amphritea balenae TaxID=452629 RepID=A0A3P1SJ12_9GAMM|nr:MFS transporter [Amphritea balenae]RRC97046.1 MFS transporter [Amphritea balenae]GGK67559.1 MFS transporter [Amphritea balenae]
MSSDLSTFYSENPSARWLALASICIAVFLIPQSMSSVNIALPAIAEALQADAVLVSWIPAANLWGSIVLMLPAGRIADIVGRKLIYLIGVLGFALASLLVLLVDTVEMLIGVRVLQGLFSGLVFATAMAIVAAVFSNNNRGTALGLTATSVYLGLTCGPLVGGWLTEHISWQSVFWVPVPLALVSLSLVMIFVKNDRISNRDSVQKPQSLDWLGSLLFMVCVSLLLFGLAGLPALVNLAMLIAGVALLLLFIYQQNRSEKPLIRFKVLAENRVMNRSLIASFLMYSGNYPVLFLLSLYLQYLQGMSPSESGQLVLIQALMMAILAPVAGRLSDRFQPRLIATAGCLLFSSGFGLLVFLSEATSYTYLVVAMVLLGIGFGCFSSPNNNAALGSVPQDRLSIASALLNLSRTSGNMFSMAIIMLLVNLFLGSEQIQPDQYPQLMRLVQTGFVIAFGYTLLAAWFSYSRGNVER